MRRVDFKTKLAVIAVVVQRFLVMDDIGLGEVALEVADFPVKWLRLLVVIEVSPATSKNITRHVLRVSNERRRVSSLLQR